MGFVLLLLGITALVWAFRTREKRAEWLLCGVLLAGVGATQVIDARNAPRNPDFARPRQEQPQTRGASGTGLGGGVAYRGLVWLEEGGRRYIAGELELTFNDPWDRVRMLVEVFDALGNSVGVVNQEFRRLQPYKPVEIKIEVPIPNASRFEVLRFDTN